MKTRLAVLAAFFCCAAACSSPSQQQSMMMPDPMTPTSQGPGPDLATSGADLAQSVQPDLASAADLATCQAPTGTTCPTTAGNCLGIGKPCTKGGGECAPEGNSCDKDLDPSGEGVCVKFGACTPGMHQCGAGATCCKTATTLFVSVCIANACLPDDCTAE